MVIDAPVYSEYGVGNQSFVTSYSVSLSSGDIYLSVSVPCSWLADSNRNYPIVIDPTVLPPNAADTFVGSGCPNNSYGSDTHIYVGYNPGAFPCPLDWGTAYGLIRFPLSPTIPTCI